MICPAISLARIGAYAAVAAAIFLAGMAAHKVFSDRKLAKLEAAHATQVANWERKVAENQREARAKEAAMQDKIDATRLEADSAIRSAQELNEQVADANRRLAAAVAGAGRLRDQLAAYTVSRGAADSIAACVGRTERLGASLASCSDLLDESVGLLSEGADLVRASAQAADVRGAKLAACLRGWPQ